MNSNHRPNQEEKLLSLEALTEIISLLKDTGKTIAHCHGVFDLIHPGHIKHLQAAKNLADVLVVTITPDEYVNKGAGRPVFVQQLRAESLAAFACIDYVAINCWPSAVRTIELLKPNYFVKGDEYEKGDDNLTQFTEEERVIASVGGEIRFTHEITFSSSNLINAFMDVLPQEGKDWLKDFRRKFSIKDIIRSIDDLADLKVAVLGDVLVNEIHYCRDVGPSDSGPFLAFDLTTSKKFAVGSVAVANQLSAFCNSVDLITTVSDRDDEQIFMTNSLHDQVNPIILTREVSALAGRELYINEKDGTPLFEIHNKKNPFNKNKIQNEDLTVELDSRLSSYDAIMILDYGYECMYPAILKVLPAFSSFLGLYISHRTPDNNICIFNQLPSLNYVSLSASSISNIENNIDPSVHQWARKLTGQGKVDKVSIFSGNQGSYYYSKGKNYTHVPAMKNDIDFFHDADFLATLTALLVAQGVPDKIVGFIENTLIAALNDKRNIKNSMNTTSLKKHITCLLK